MYEKIIRASSSCCGFRRLAPAGRGCMIASDGWLIAPAWARKLSILDYGLKSQR